MSKIQLFKVYKNKWGELRIPFKQDGRDVYYVQSANNSFSGKLPKNPIYSYNPYKDMVSENSFKDKFVLTNETNLELSPYQIEKLIKVCQDIEIDWEIFWKLSTLKVTKVIQNIQ